MQNPLPLIMGGSKGKIFERIARYGNGWYAPTTSPMELESMLKELRSVCRRLGRDFGSIEITTMWPGQGGREPVKAFEVLGVHRLVVPLMALGPNPLQGLSALSQSVLQP